LLVLRAVLLVLLVLLLSALLLPALLLALLVLLPLLVLLVLLTILVLTLCHGVLLLAFVESGARRPPKAIWGRDSPAACRTQPAGA
jgi:hypothetical protein